MWLPPTLFFIPVPEGRMRPRGLPLSLLGGRGVFRRRPPIPLCIGAPMSGEVGGVPTQRAFQAPMGVPIAP